MDERNVERLISAYNALGRLKRARRAVRDLAWIGQSRVEWPATEALLKQWLFESCTEAVEAMSACMGAPALTGLQPVINAVSMPTTKELDARLHRAFTRVAQVIKRLESKA